MILSVITPCTRPANLPLIEQALLAHVCDHFMVRWMIGYERGTLWADVGVSEVALRNMAIARWERETDGANGNPQRNEALNMVRDDGYGEWVAFLDDDTVPHPLFGTRLAAAIRLHPDKRGFLFSQLNHHGELRLVASQNVSSGMVDTAQFVFRRDYIGEHRWNAAGYDADYHFWHAVTNGRMGEMKIMSEERITIYNALRK